MKPDVYALALLERALTIGGWVTIDAVKGWVFYRDPHTGEPAALRTGPRDASPAAAK